MSVVQDVLVCIQPDVGHLSSSSCLQDVAVSVVGKYRYTMNSPAEHDRVPIIVDIILVGRTKIITLHSSLWLENHTDRAVSFRLHVPLTPLTAPTHPANSSQDPTGNIIIGPFPSGSGESWPSAAVAESYWLLNVAVIA